MAADIDFYFDPVCPFAWMTSKWVRQVQARNAAGTSIPIMVSVANMTASPMELENTSEGAKEVVE